jgi:hypothetical protein
MSPPHIVCSGNPQGCVISPDIWNFFVLDCPKDSEVHSCHADDINQVDSDADLISLRVKSNRSVQATSEWSKRKDLVLAPNKLQVTLFTPDTKQTNAHPQVFIDGTLVMLCKKPKPVGVNTTTRFSILVLTLMTKKFNPHSVFWL